jgi:hypothetical protein
MESAILKGVNQSLSDYLAGLQPLY